VLTDSAIELSGRTALVLLAREMLYRACEASINDTTASGLADSLYMNAVAAIRELGIAAKTESGAKLIEAIASAPEGTFRAGDSAEEAGRSQLIRDALEQIFEDH
jgi:hypothetical protein